MIPLGEKSKREQMILEAKINREHMKMGLEEGRKDELHDHKAEQERLKLEKAKAELEALYQKMQLERADLEFKSEIEKTKLQMEMQKAEAEVHMDLADRQMQSKREDDKHNVSMSHENNKNQLDLHKRSADAHMNQQLKYHSAKAKAAMDPEAPHEVPELDLRDIPKPKAFRQGTPSVFNAGNSGYEQGTKSVMGKVKMPNFAMPKPSQGYHHGGYAEAQALSGMDARQAQHPPVPQGYWLGIDEVIPDPKKQQQQQQAGAQIYQRMDSSGNAIQNNYVLADSTKQRQQAAPPTATLATSISPQARWEAAQAAKRQRGYNHGTAGAPPHPMTGKAPTNPEAGPSDTVPTMLTPGEAVIPREAAQNPKNKPLINALIQEGRHVQKFGHGTSGVPGYALGSHHVQGYVAGTQSVADTDIYWANQGESATTQQTEEEKKRRIEQQVAPVQNEDGSSQAMGVPPVDPQGSIEFSSQKVERPAHADSTPDRMDTNQSTPDQRLNQRVENEEAAMASIPKPEEGWGSKITKGLGAAGSIFGMNADEVKRMAAQAAAAKLMGYNTKTALNAGFKGAMHQADQRAQRQHQADVIAQQDRRLDSKEAQAAAALSSKEAAASKAAEAKEQKAAYQGAFKEEYARLTKEEFLPEHEARAKADAYAKALATGQAQGGGEAGSSGQPQVRQGQYLGQPLVGQYAHAPSKPGHDVVLTDPKTMATKQVPTHIIKVKGVDTPFVNAQMPEGGYKQIPLQEYKQMHLNQGYGVHDMSANDTLEAKKRAQEQDARARQTSAIQLASHNMAVRAEGRSIESHQQSMANFTQSQQDHAIKTIKANLPEFVAGTTEKDKGSPEKQVNRDKIANGVLQTARELGINPNDTAFIHMVEQTGSLIANDPKLSKTVSPEGVRRALMTTIVSGLPDGGHLVQPVQHKDVASGDRKITPEEAQRQATAQVAFGGVIDGIVKSGKAKNPGQAFGILQQDWNALPAAEQTKWKKRAEGSGMTGFMFRANNL